MEQIQDAIGSKAEIRPAFWGPRFDLNDPKAKWRVNGDFIRECEHRGRDVEAKSLGSRERR
jgi:hypothetical protein